MSDSVFRTTKRTNPEPWPLPDMEDYPETGFPQTNAPVTNPAVNTKANFKVDSYQFVLADFNSTPNASTEIIAIGLYGKSGADDCTAVLSFHSPRSALGLANYRNKVVYIHYDIGMLVPIMNLLSSSVEVYCQAIDLGGPWYTRLITKGLSKQPQLPPAIVPTKTPPPSTP